MSVRPRKFSLESDMTVPARNWLEFAGFKTKDEFRTPWGVCDLAGVKLSKRYIESRLSLGQSRPVGNAKRVALLECIPSDRDISARELARRTSHLFLMDELQTELKQLQADHFLRRTERDWFIRLVPKSAERNLILAVEIKLGKVEEALSQARANLGFAHESYIGIPMANAERLAGGGRSEELRSSGVGLLSVERGRCEVLIQSTGDDSRTNLAVRAHCIERFWRTIIDSAA